MADWTEETRTEIKEAYIALNPTPENTVELLEKLAEDFDTTINGARTILSKEGVYVKKAQTAKPAAKAASTRVSKADAQEALKDAIEALGKEVDMSIIDKLTGKAAQYLTEIISPAKN